MIAIKRVQSHKEKRAFIQFPFQLYKDNPYWVPPLMRSEWETLDADKNPVFDTAEAHFFLAYRDGEVVGRIAAFINWTEVRQQGVEKMRFGWFDTLDDLDVTRALIQAVQEVAKGKNLSFLEGPLGFSNLDKAGLLTRGFEVVSTMATAYNHPYYEKHLLDLGFEKATEWVEYNINVPTQIPAKVQRFARLIQAKYGLKILRFQSKRELAQYADALFDLLDETHSSLSAYVPISERQKRYYIQKFIRFIHLDYLIAISDESDAMIAFAITMPSYSKALQRAKGRLFPLGFIHLLRAHQKNDRADLYLIGIKPSFQKKGVTAILFNELMKTFIEKGIKRVETNPDLVENKSVRALWKHYDHNMHKARSTYKRAVE